MRTRRRWWPRGRKPSGGSGGVPRPPPWSIGHWGPDRRARSSASAVNSTSTAGTRPRRSPCSRRPPAGCAAPYQAHFLLAQAYTLAGRPADAATAAARAEEIRLDVETATTLSQEAADKPWDPAVRHRLAAVFDRLGDAELAAMWRRAAAAVGARP